MNLIILTDFHNFTQNEDKLQNFSTGRFLLKFGYAILVKIWKWVRLLNSFRFIKKTLANHVYIRIWLSSLTLTVLALMKTNFKISQFSRFLVMSEYASQVKIRNWLKVLNSVPIIKKNTCKSCLHSNLIILTDFHGFTLKVEKLQNQSIFKISPEVWVCDFGQNLKMTKTS